MGRVDGLTRGRDGNMHMGDLSTGVVSIISALAATVPVAAGVALALHYQGKDGVAFCYFGDGATSRGDWHEGVNLATVQKLPVVFLLQQQPVRLLDAARAADGLRQRGRPRPGLQHARRDRGRQRRAGGVRGHAAAPVAHARAGLGPYLLECKTFRMTGHSAHDAAHYVPPDLFEEWDKRDPITRLETRMLENGWAERAALDAAHAAHPPGSGRSRGLGRASPYPDPATLLDGVYEQLVAMPTTYLEAIREGLWEEMERDPNVFLIGEDIGVYGGAFKVTAGFIEHFGARRVVDTPISESAIVGAAIGAGLMGLRPVAEMQFADFISCGFDQIVNFAAKCRYRWNAPRAHGGARAFRRRHSRRPVPFAEPGDVVRARRPA